MVKHFASQSRLRRPRFYSGCIIARHSAESRPFGGRERSHQLNPFPPIRGVYPGFSPAKRTAYFIFAALLIAFRRLLYPSNKAAFFCRFHSFSFSHNSFHFRYLGHFSWHFFIPLFASLTADLRSSQDNSSRSGP